METVKIRPNLICTISAMRYSESQVGLIQQKTQEPDKSKAPEQHVDRPTQKRRTLEKLHQCKMCEKSFTQRRNLEVHMLTHKSLTLRQLLKTHKSLALRQLLKTDKSFALRRLLKTHKFLAMRQVLKTHKFLLLRQLLKIHKVHHNLRKTKDQPNSCDQCGKTFQHKSALIVHVRSDAFTDSEMFRSHFGEHSLVKKIDVTELDAELHL